MIRTKDRCFKRVPNLELKSKCYRLEYKHTKKNKTFIKKEEKKKQTIQENQSNYINKSLEWN